MTHNPNEILNCLLEIIILDQTPHLSSRLKSLVPSQHKFNNKSRPFRKKNENPPSIMPSKIRLKDLAIGMFVEVYSGNPKTPWFGEIFQILAKKKSVLAKTSAKRGGGGGGKGGDEAFEPIAVKWIARVNGAKGKAYEYKGGSNMIWLESIIKCGFDLDCGVYLQKKGGKKTPAAAKTTALAVRKSTPTKTTALAVRKSTPTKTESTKVQRQILAAKAQLAKAHERKRREKAKLTKTVRELKRKLATAEKALAKLDSGHGIAKRKKTQTATGTKTLKPKLVSTKSPGKKALNGKKKSSWLWKGPSKVARKSAPIQLHPFGNLGASDTDSEDEM